MPKISWKGLFEATSEDYAKDFQWQLTNFLEEANLICSGMTVVGYQYEDHGDFEKIEIVTHPEHCNFIDLRIGVTRKWRHIHLWDGMSVRVFWNCRGAFPAEMGIPTRIRLKKAVEEFNQTGIVKTKKDDTPSIPSRIAEPYLRMKAALRTNSLQ